MPLVDGRFELGPLLALGGMGRLFSAIDLTTQNRVAVKQLTLDGVDARQRFEREAEMLSLVSHPNVVRYVAHGRHGEQFYLAMELVQGETVGARITREGLTLRDAVVVTLQVISALSELHRIGLVHRDIKPSNLMIPRGGVEPLKLVDFGLVRDAAGAAPLTSTGMAVGSPGYMSPEQARGDRAVTSAVDVYALGCVLYLAITGRHPFPGDTALAVQAKILTYSPPAPRALNPECPELLSIVTMEMLAFEPERRPTLGALATVLESFTSLGPSRPQKQWSTSERQLSPQSTAEVALRAESFAVAMSMQREDDTTPADIPAATLTALSELAENHGAKLGATHVGTCVFTSRPDATPRDRAFTGAQLALSARAHFPDWSVALALGPVDADVVVDRALALLNSELLNWLVLGRRAGVRVDEDTWNRLEGDAELKVDRSARLLVSLHHEPVTLGQGVTRKPS